jgi:hypothetical protein
LLERHLPEDLAAATANAAGGEQEDAMAKKSRGRTSGRKRSATADMTQQCI